MAELTREEKIEKLRQMAEGTAPPAGSAPPAEAAGTQDPAPTTPPATSETAGSEAKAADVPEVPAAPAVEAAPAAEEWWKAKVKVLDEEREVDLKSMTPAERHELIGRGLSHETIKERLRAARDEAREALEAARRQIAARDLALRDLASKGYRIETNPSTGEIRVLGPAPQPAAPEAAGQTDLDALEKKAMDEGTPEAWRDYMRAIRKTAGRQLTDAQVNDVVKSRLEEARRADQAQLAEAQRQAEEVTVFKRKLEGVFETHKGSFEKAGPLADYWRNVARREAYLASGVEGATHESVLKVVSDIATKLDGTYAHAQTALAQQAAKPRPKAPTVLAGAGAPPPSATDPAKYDLKTPEGRKAAADYLRAQAERRQHAVSGV